MCRGLVVGIVLMGMQSVPGLQAESFRPVYERGTGTFVLDFTFEGKDDAPLLSPSGLRVDQSGNVWVLEQQLALVKKFAANGTHLATIDSRGQGPGDIGLPTKLAVDADGNVVIYDIGNRRFAFFGKDAKFLRMVKFPEIVWGFDLGPNGMLYVETHEQDRMETKGGTTIRLWRYSASLKDGIVIDSLLVKDNTYLPERSYMNVPVPFHPTMEWAITPIGHIVIAKSDDYTVRILRPDLAVITQFQREGTRLKVTKADKEKHFSGISTTVDGVFRMGAPDYIRDATEFPEYKPYFSTMTVDHEGYVLFKTYEESEGGVIFEVFDPEGAFVNRVTLPSVMSSCVLAGGYAYRIEGYDDEQASVGRYRLE